MNISATHLSAQVSVTPPKVAEATLPQLNISSTTISSEQVVIETVSPATSSNDSTYNRPIPVTSTVIEQEQSNQSPSEQSVINEEGETAPEAENPENETIEGKKATEIDAQHDADIHSETELAQISALKSLDSEVMAHERAHAAVGGQYAGTPTYSYTTGPDGVKYAVSGEVSIDTSAVSGDPQATLQKAKQIKLAALAPAEPSAQDRKVAAKADQMARQARSDILAGNSDDEGNSQNLNISYATTAQDYFTNTLTLSSDNSQITVQGNSDIDNDTHDAALKKLMHERNEHIYDVYQNSSRVNISANFQVQV